ncbi:hypothetical protein [Propionivibrio sp.]|uniref:hypothetical protein n=1 Tax=Propionivibrio sp. TaxID=2212460 RepID=UPI00272EA484|nr:hypothetical protein [Propionivibrio sp.]
MLKRLIILATLAAAWVSALWFGVAPDFGQWSLPRLAAVHALPPLFCGGLWLGWRRWRDRVAEARTRAMEERAEEERQAGEENARRLATEESQRNRFGCDCRAVALAQVSAGDGDVPLAEMCQGVYLSSFESSAADVDERAEVVAHLRSGMHEALGAIYASSPAAVSLPLYVVPPGEARADEFVNAVRGVQHALIEEGGLLFDGVRDPGRILQLAEDGGVLSALLRLFEQNPGLAVVLLGTDSPWLQAQNTDEEEEAVGAGKPGQGVFAMLLTHPDFVSDDADSALEKDEALRSRPVLARLHRPAMARMSGGKTRANVLARTLGKALDEARRYAGMDKMLPACDGVEANEQEGGGGSTCSWLVHNAGTPANCGVHMAGLGVALLEHGIELDPFDEATNISTVAGDLGDALDVGMLSVAVARAAATQGAALCVEFRRDATLSIFFARAPESAEMSMG